MRNDPAPTEVFEFLDQTHRAIEQHLQALQQLVPALQQAPWTAQQAAQVEAICEYFDTEARQHHLDEELHILPALVASTDAQIQHVAAQVMQDHGWLEAAWLAFEPLLRASTQQQSWVDVDLLMQHFELLCHLYREHMVLEESVAYPQAKASARAWDGQGIGREMARRRAQAQSQKAATTDV